MNYYNEYDEKAAQWLRELISHRPESVLEQMTFLNLLNVTSSPESADGPVWTGSCPCQPFSNAGKGLAQADDRHL